MTVSYQYKVASSTSGGFTRLLFMWRGSLYKLIYRELLIFLIAFGILSMLYRNLFTTEQKIIFEKMVTYSHEFISMIPLEFILGFYVAYVAARWWQQYEAIPWPDKCMHTIALYITGNDNHTRMIRRTLMRYLNLTLVLILRSISSAVKKRFPTLDHLTEVGFMTQTEKQMFLAIPNCDFNTYWIPCAWFVHTLKDAKAENSNIDPMGVKLIMEEFNEFRGKCGILWSYDWISIPLVYTQVVTLATYSFFLVAAVARQYVENSDKKMQMKIDIYLPVFTILQFFFFMGLLKVAEQLINPFGDDDEDFELNWLIDRHTKVSYLGVDTLMLHRPPLTKDKYFDSADLVLPYTEASAIYKKKTYRGSFHNMQVPEDQQDLYLPEIIEEDSDENSIPVKSRRQSIFVNPFIRRTSDDDLNSTIPRNRRKSIFSNLFDKRSSFDKTMDSGRLHNENLSNGLNGEHKSTSPVTNKKVHDNLDFDRISIISTKGSDDIGTSIRRGSPKHNSMMAAPGNRKQKWSSIREKRRRSVPTLILQKENAAVRRDSSVRSKRRDSVMDAQWKGIRWKPYTKEEDPNESVNVARNVSQHLDTDFTFINQAYTNSTVEEHDKDTVKDNAVGKAKKQERNHSNDRNCDTARRTSPHSVNADVVLHLPVHDSLV